MIKDLNLTSAEVPATQVVKLRVGTKERRYLVRLPPQFDGRKQLPAVVIFHGAGGTARLYLDRNGWQKLADEEGFLAVAPDGQVPQPGQPSHFLTNPQLWNDGSGRLVFLGDELPFVAALLDDLEQRFQVDSRRLYLTGHSNGAGLTFHLATRLASRLAAVAPVMSHCWAEAPILERPVPTLYIVGMKDPLIPFAGGEAPHPWGGPIQIKPAVATTVDRWRAALGCIGTPVTLIDDEGTRIEEHRDSADRPLMRLAILKQHGHGWPGGAASGLPAELIGPVTHGFNATEAIWQFFKNQRR